MNRERHKRADDTPGVLSSPRVILADLLAKGMTAKHHWDAIGINPTNPQACAGRASADDLRSGRIERFGRKA